MSGEEPILRVSDEMRRLFRDWRRGVDTGCTAPLPRSRDGRSGEPTRERRPLTQNLRIRRDGCRPIEATGWLAIEVEAEQAGAGQHRLALYCVAGGSVCISAAFQPVEGSGLRPVHSAAVAPDAETLLEALAAHRPSAAIVFGMDDQPRTTLGADLDAEFDDLARAAGLRWPPATSNREE